MVLVVSASETTIPSIQKEDDFISYNATYETPKSTLHTQNPPTRGLIVLF